MDKMVYMITEAGVIDSVFDNEAERDAKLKELLKQENKYEVTHFYYDSREMAEGEYVCQHLCKYVETGMQNAKFVAERNGEPFDKVFINAMKNCFCCKCICKKYSPYMEEEDA